MRPKLKELCGINPIWLKDLLHHESSLIIIDACQNKYRELAMELDESRCDNRYTYDDKVIIQEDMKYLSKAIKGRVSDYEEMGLTYRQNRIREFHDIVNQIKIEIKSKCRRKFVIEFYEIVDKIKAKMKNGKSDKVIFDNEVAEVLGLSINNLATRKTRNSIPFKEILDWCKKQDVDVMKILYHV